MINRSREFIRTYRFKKYYGIDRNEYRKFVYQCTDDHNFFTVHDARSFKENLTISDYFIAKYIKKNTSIHEVACGIGSNLLYLAHQGFCNLSGSDINPLYLDCAKKLFIFKNLYPRFWLNDVLNPCQKSEEKFGLIMSFYWSHAVDGFNFKDFLSYCSKILNIDGYVVFEAIDDSYNKYPNQEFNINDLHLPLAQRRKTQFINRTNDIELIRLANQLGFKVIENHLTKRFVPKRVYLLQYFGDSI